MCKRINGNLTMKRWIKFRVSDERKRFDLKYKKLRKKWWHYKTRWETS